MALMQNTFPGLVFNVLKEYSGTVFLKETIEALFRTKNNICEEEIEEICCHSSDKLFMNSSNPSTINYGYPEYPLYLTLSKALCEWMKHGKSVLHIEKTNLELLEENEIPFKRIVCKLVDLKLKFLQKSWDCISIAGKKMTIVEILEMLEMRGILDLIGMRETTGSINVVPPPAALLWESFNVKHKQGANLSCGARALSKHCHRDSTLQWWGVSTGSEHDKNEYAKSVLEKIIGDAVWINIHMLPHDVKVLEVRNTLGYGARWSHDGKTFRGFLEPQIHDGHTVGWKH